MSRRKKQMMTPAAVAEQLAAYIAKQEKTLQRYPVGPLANTAKMNLMKGKKALAALQDKNEEMRVGMEPQQGQQMTLGGNPTGVADSSFGITGAQQAMVDTLATEYGMSPAIAAAVASVTQKESGGSGVREEMDYRNTSNERIRTLNSRFKRKFGDMSDEDLNALKADPEKFFNFVYDDVAGNDAEGDGYKYRGRGLVQVTGKENYRRVSQAVYGDDRLVDNPDLLLDDKVAGAAAAYFTAESGKGVEGYVDFDLNTPDPTPEQIQQVLNGTYAVVASGGTLPKSTAQDPEKMAQKYGQYSSAMGKMQQFAQQAVPSASVSAGATPQATSLQDTPDFMLSQQGQAEKAAVLGQDAQAVPEAAATPPVAQADPERAGQFSALGDLDFNGAQSRAGTADLIGNVSFARNEYGDYNVIHPERGKFVVRQGDWNPNDIETTLNSGIPYDDAVDGPATNSDRLQTLVSPLTDDTQFNLQLQGEARGISERLGVANSGMGLSFRDVANIVAEQRGVKPVKTNTQRVMGDMGKSFTTVVPDPQDQARYDREMDEIYAEIAASPGTYKFQNEVTVPLFDPTEEDIAELEAEGYTIKTGALGVKTATRVEEHVGVGGYSPMSDYVAYATNDPDYQNRFQNRQQTRGLIGNLIAPGNIAGPVRAAAVSRGTAALGKGLGDDAITAIQAGDDAALQLAVGQEVKALGQGQKVLPQGSAGPAVKGVPGMKFKPGTGAQGQAPTYVPAQNAAGRTIDITPVSTSKTLSPEAQRINELLGMRPKAQVLQSLGAKPGTPLSTAIDDAIAARGIESVRSTLGLSPRGVGVLDDAGGAILGVPRGQFRFPAGSAGGQGGRFGGMQPGGLSMPGSRLPAVRNVGLQTTRQSSTALGPVNPMTGLPARSALQRGTIGLADDAMGSIPTIERASGIGGNIFTRTPFALERLGVVGAETYFPRFDERIFPEGQEAGETPVPPVVDSDGDDVPDIIDGDGGEGTAGEGTPPNKRDETPVDKTELTGPDTYNIDMGNAAALMGVPALASLASAGIQRRALNQMQAPTAPVLNQIPNFDYRSNVGQQLMDAREASRAAGQNTNLQGAQQAALAQSLNVQRMQQETRIRQGDEAMRQQALDRYNTSATQMRQLNNAMINQYNQDRTNFDNAMTQAQAAVSQQPLNVVSGVAQDYLKNIYQTNMANTLEGIGRQFNTGNIAGQNFGMQQGNLVPVTNSEGAIIGYQQAPQ